MMELARDVAIFTGNRAEYGLQYPIIRAIDAHPDLEYKLIVSGAHLDEGFGYTKTEIEKDGFHVDAEVRADVRADDLYSTTQAIGKIILGLGDALNELKPDFLVVYADRFEGLAAVVAGSQMGLPVAHIEGGDITEGGALDDYVRHAMTKLAQIHFTTNEEATGRILRLGEEPWRVHTVGFPVIDLIREGRIATGEEIRERFGIDPDAPLVVFTQHSITTEVESAIDQLRPSLEAMSYLADEGVQVLVTYPNNDAGGRAIVAELQRLGAEHHANMWMEANVGRYFYHGLLGACARSGRGACVGNSSSGIKETPAFGLPTVNIGTRQKGRLRACNVIDASHDYEEIVTACKKALFDADFRAVSAACENPYGKGDSGRQIAEVLACVPLDKHLIQKRMTY
jgi:UDP-hydrolysing UDP-N-acetyl-D-glucosamine 2-epimerase